jgi:hypothetical protein
MLLHAPLLVQEEQRVQEQAHLRVVALLLLPRPLLLHLPAADAASAALHYLLPLLLPLLLQPAVAAAAAAAAVERRCCLLLVLLPLAAAVLAGAPADRPEPDLPCQHACKTQHITQ